MKAIANTVAAALKTARPEEKAQAHKAVVAFRETYHRTWVLMPKACRALLESIEEATSN